MLPKNWPQEFSYLSQPIPADFHPIFLRQILSTHYEEDQKKVIELLDEKQVHPHLEICVISKDLEYLKGRSHILANTHALKGHFSRGVFAKAPIDQGVVIGEYAGLVFYSSEGIPDEEWISEYTWLLKVGSASIAIKADSMANELAFVNDYRNIASEPNACMQSMVHRGSLHFCYITTKPIQSGEEILIKYR